MQLELKRIQAELGTTFVYVTHDQEEALAMSDRIAVMNGGRVEQIGSPREIYERPETAFIADFIGSLNALDLAVGRARRLRIAVMRLGEHEAWSSRSDDHPTGDTVRDRRPSRARSDRAVERSSAPTAARVSTGRSPRSCTSACTRSSMSTRAWARRLPPPRRRVARRVRERRVACSTLGAQTHAGAALALERAEPPLGDPSAQLRRTTTTSETTITTTATAMTCGSWFGKRGAE